MTENLWGELPEVQALRTPKQLLLEQANFLREMTGGKLVGRVVDHSSHSGFLLDFFVIAPTLNQYSFKVLQVNHDVHLYPATITASTGKRVCRSENDLLEGIRSVLQSARIKKSIVGLLAHINASSDDETDYELSNGAPP